MLYADRVRETTATNSTGTVTLAGAVSGFRTFASAFTNLDTVRYCIALGTEWEVGQGVYNVGTLSRVTVFASSNAGALVDFSAGAKGVWCDLPATGITAATHGEGEFTLAAGLQVVPDTVFSRIGGRKLDLSRFPILAGHARHVRFLCCVDKTAGATSGTIQLYDVTNGVVVTDTNLVTTSLSNEELDSGDLAVGGAAGNIRTDVVSMYEVQMKRTGGAGGVDAVYCTDARLVVYYT